MKTALLPKERYWGVIRHRNYNPRVIEHAVSLDGVDSLSPDEFVRNIFATLDDPTKVWERIFENLSTMARRVLLAVASLPTEVFLEDVRHAVESLSPKDFDAGEFRNAVSMVEGTLIDLREAEPGSRSRRRLVVIRDPSVRDYLWARLEVVDGEADALLRAAVFFEQCLILYEGRNYLTSTRITFIPRIHTETRNRNVVSYKAVASRAVELVNSASPVVRRWKYENLESFDREPISLERRTNFLIGVLTAHQSSRVVASSANACLVGTVEEWEAGRGSPSDGLELLNQAMKVGDLLNGDILERAGRALLGLTTNRLQQKEDFEVLTGLYTVNPDLFEEPQRDLDSWSSEFGNFLDGERSWFLEEIDDPDWLEEEMRMVRRIAGALGTDISDLEAYTESRIEELRTELEPDNYDDMPELYSDPPDESDVEAIDALFQSLR